MVRIAGVDLALRHWSVATIEVATDTPYLELISSISGGIRTKGSIGLSQLPSLAQEIFRASEGCSYVGIDWDPRDLYWGNRKSAGFKAFLAGHLYANYTCANQAPLFIPPWVVRKYLGVAIIASKEEVHQAFSRSVVYKLYKPWDSLSDHERDALILAYVRYLCSQSLEKGNDPIIVTTEWARA